MREVQACYRGNNSLVALRDLYNNLNKSHCKVAIVPYSVIRLIKEAQGSSPNSHAMFIWKDSSRSISTSIVRVLQQVEHCTHVPP